MSDLGADAGNLTLTTTETCQGWPMMATGQCGEELDIKLSASECGTLHGVTITPLVLTIQ